MLLHKTIQHVVGQLCELLQQLPCNDYRRVSTVLNGASIGQHVRHTIELFQCLLAGYEQGIVNYDHRKRDITIESYRYLATELLAEIARSLVQPNKNMILKSAYDEEQGDVLTVETNFYREVVYNLEHTIHHMALIRIGVSDVSGIVLDDSFGVAPSTTQYRKACAQ